MLMNVKIPHQTFNRGGPGRFGGREAARILEAIKPEAAYFTEHNGQAWRRAHRGFADASKIRCWPSPGS